MDPWTPEGLTLRLSRSYRDSAVRGGLQIMMRSQWLRIALMLGVVTLGLALSITITPRSQVLFSIQVLAVLVAAWHGGLLMGLSATALSAIASVAITHIYIQDHPIGRVNVVALIIFAIVGAVVSAFMDRRRRQQIQLEDLQAQHARLAEVMHSIGIGHWYSDLPTQQMFWDAQCKAHYGLPPDAEITLDVLLGCVHPDDRDRLQGAAERAIFGHTSCDVDYRVVHRDGEVRWLRALGRGFYDKAGKPTRFDGITVDVTRQKMAEETLAEANRLKDQFLGALSHELRTPLNAVLGWARLLATGELPSHRVPHAVSVIERNAQAQARLVEDLLDLSSVVTGKLRLRIEPVDLGAVSLSALEGVRPAADARQVQLTDVGRSRRAVGAWRPGSPAADRLEPAVERREVHAASRHAYRLRCCPRARASGWKSATRGAGSSQRSCRTSSIASRRPKGRRCAACAVSVSAWRSSVSSRKRTAAPSKREATVRARARRSS